MEKAANRSIGVWSLLMAHRWTCQSRSTFPRRQMVAVLLLVVPPAASFVSGQIQPPSWEPVDNGLECGWEFHFDQLDGNPAQNCLSSFAISHDRETQTTLGNPVTTEVNTIFVPALCFFPIPCNFDNPVFTYAITNFTQWQMSVSGEATLAGKVELGQALLALLGALNVSVQVTG